MIKIRTAVLFGVAIVLVSVLATAAYFRTTAPMSTVPIPAANPVSESVDLPLAVPQPAASRSLYLSDEALAARLDRLFERGQMQEARALLHILNDRYERRCCGLPR